MIKYSLLIFTLLLLTACYGPRINKKTVNNEIDYTRILSETQNQDIALRLNTILVKNQANSWAKDAKWDEYIFQVINLSSTSMYIKEIVVYDALGDKIHSLQTRKELKVATSSQKSKFKNNGFSIKWGAGSTVLLTESILGTVVGTGIAAGLAGTGAITTSAGTLTVAGGAIFFAVPAIAISGIVKLMNNKKIDKQLKNRQSHLPKLIESRQQTHLDLFYPSIPGPKKIAVYYTLNNQKKKLTLDLNARFDKLHFKTSKK